MDCEFAPSSPDASGLDVPRDRGFNPTNKQAFGVVARYDPGEKAALPCSSFARRSSGCSHKTARKWFGGHLASVHGKRRTSAEL